jgi:hypothetical protein
MGLIQLEHCPDGHNRPQAAYPTPNHHTCIKWSDVEPSPSQVKWVASKIGGYQLYHMCHLVLWLIMALSCILSTQLLESLCRQLESVLGPKERGSCSLVCLGILGDCTSLVSSALVVSGDFICKLDVVLYWYCSWSHKSQRYYHFYLTAFIMNVTGGKTWMIYNHHITSRNFYLINVMQMPCNNSSCYLPLQIVLQMGSWIYFVLVFVPSVFRW